MTGLLRQELLPTAQWLETPLINIPSTPIINDYEALFVSFGSCFAQNLKSVIDNYGFNYWFNRDICAHYSALSIASTLERVAEGNSPTAQDLYVFDDGGLMAYAYFFKRRFYGENAEEALLRKMAQLDQQCREKIANCTHMVVTLGTSRILKFRKDMGGQKAGAVINAAAGIPAEHWQSYMLSVEENVANLERIYESVCRIRGGSIPQMIFTLSPQRYLFGKGVEEDLFVDNMLGKATLRVAISEFVKNHLDESVYYFPAFEIVMEELRLFESLSHYDFTHIDQTHTPQYVVKRFLEAYCTPNIYDQMVLLEGLRRLIEEIGSLLDAGMLPNNPRILGFVEQALDELDASRQPFSPVIEDALDELFHAMIFSTEYKEPCADARFTATCRRLRRAIREQPEKNSTGIRHLAGKAKTVMVDTDAA